MKNLLTIIMIISAILFLNSSARGQVFPPANSSGPFPTGLETIRDDAPFDKLELSDVIHEYTCYKGTPIIDGDVDNDPVWQQIPYTPMEWYEIIAPHSEFEIYDNESDTYLGQYDHFAQFKMLWDGSLIYMAIQVIDDDYYDLQPQSNVWNNDCIQLGLHTRPMDSAQGGTGIGNNFGYIQDTVRFHRPMVETHNFAHTQMLPADGSGSYYFVNDGLFEEGKAILCRVDDSNADYSIVTWEIAFDPYWGDLGPEVIENSVARLSLLALDMDEDDNLIFQGSGWGKGILTTKNMDHFGSVLFSQDAAPSSGIETTKIAPTFFTLAQNYPNPFNPSTTINFSIPQHAQVSLAVFDVNGRLVNQLLDGGMTAGSHTITWNGLDMSGKPLASGVYFYRVSSQIDGTSRTLINKMMLVR